MEFLAALAQSLGIAEKLRQFFRKPSHDTFHGDMSPRDYLLYVHQESKWGSTYNDKASFFWDVQMGLRDALRLGQIRATGRASGTWIDTMISDSVHRPVYPSKFIDPEFWEHGDINWIRSINSQYAGPIDAWDMQSRISFEDVRLDAAEVRRRWPRRNWITRRLMKPKFQVLDNPSAASQRSS